MNRDLSHGKPHSEEQTTPSQASCHLPRFIPSILIVRAGCLYEGGSMGEKLTCIDRYAHTWNRRKGCKRGIVGIICVYFANGSLVLDLNRAVGESCSLLCSLTTSRFPREGGVLTSPVVVYVSHDGKFPRGFPLFF